MEIIRHHHPATPGAEDQIIPIPANRETLAKRRWRGVAADGREFGFDLDQTVNHGAAIFQAGTTFYAIAQNEEPVLEIALSADPAEAAQLGWKIGNLHFPVQVTPNSIRVADDSAIRQMLDREKIAYTSAIAVFAPLHAVPHSHGHSHD